MSTAAEVETDPKVIAAWDEYLETCRDADHPWRYDEAEAWAWTRLQQTLAELKT